MVVVAAAVLGIGACSDRGPSGAYGTERGEAARGPEVIAEHGCADCHRIPGIRGASGRVGPPLDAFGDRRYIAGALTNTPEHLVTWLLSPQSVAPGSAMP